MFFKLVAVDRSGNRSAASAQSSGTSRQAVTLDLGPGAVERSNIKAAAIGSAEIGTAVINNLHVADVSVGKLTAGTLSADVVIGANFATALTAGRVGFDPQGFFAYDPLNIQTVRISNDGSAMLMGEIRTRETGARFVFNPGGTNPTELRVYPDTGATNYTKMKAGTVTDGFGNKHSFLQIIASRYQNDVGEPVLEMYGAQGQLTWVDSTGALGTAGLKSYVRVDRYKTSIAGGRIDLNLLDTAQGTPNNVVKMNFFGVTSLEFMPTLIAGQNYELIRGTNRALLLHNLGLSSRNRSDTTDSAMYATAFNVSSARKTKTDIRDLRPDVLDKFDASAAQVYRLTDDVAEHGDAAWWHVGPMAEDLPPEFVKPGIAEHGYVNVDDKVGIVWEVMRRTRSRTKAELARVERETKAEIARLEALILVTP